MADVGMQSAVAAVTIVYHASSGSGGCDERLAGVTSWLVH